MNDILNALTGNTSVYTIDFFKVYNDSNFILLSSLSSTKLLITKVEYDYDSGNYIPVNTPIVLTLDGESFLGIEYNNSTKYGYILTLKEVGGNTYPIIRAYNANTNEYRIILNESGISGLSNGTLLPDNRASFINKKTIQMVFATAQYLNKFMFVLDRDAVTISSLDLIENIDFSKISIEKLFYDGIVYKINDHRGTLLNK